MTLFEGVCIIELCLNNSISRHPVFRLCDLILVPNRSDVRKEPRDHVIGKGTEKDRDLR